MGIAKAITVKEGNNGRRWYYYWDVFHTYEKALHTAKKIKLERKDEMKIKYFIQQTKDSWFLPVDVYVLYLNKKLRLL